LPAKLKYLIIHPTNNFFMKKKLLFSKSLQCLVAVVFLLTTHVVNSQSVNFSGASGASYLTMPDNPSFTINASEDYTIEWYQNVDPTSYQYYRLFSFGSHSITEENFAGFSSNSASMFYRTNYGNRTLGSISGFNNTWMHIAIVRSGGVIKAYINGRSTGSTIAYDGIVTGGNFYLGALSGGENFKGKVTHFRFTKSAVYTSNFTPPVNGLVASNSILFINGGTDGTTMLNNSGSLGGTFTQSGATYSSDTPFPFVIPVPTITTSGTLNQFNTCSGTTSAVQSFTISGTLMEAAITITAPAGFEVSTSSSSGFGSSVTLANTATVASTTIYVRMTAASTGTHSGNISITSTNATTQTVAVAGTVNAVPAAPTVANTTVNYCQGGTATALTATATSGHSLQWYTVATGGTASTTAPTPSTSTSGQSMYYVAQKVTPQLIEVKNSTNNVMGSYISTSGSAGQTFNVATSFILRKIIVRDYTFSGSVTMTMRVYDSPSKTNLLGQADSTYLEPGGTASSPVFNFNNSYIVLNASTTYYYEITTSGTGSLRFYNGTSITGDQYVSGVVQSGVDMYFEISGDSMTNPCESARTAITVNVNPAPVGGTATAAASVVCSGATTTIALANSTGTIQWQKLVGSTWTDIAGETSATLTTPAIIEATSFRAKLSGQSCSDVFSNPVNVALITPPLAPGYGLDFNGTNNTISVPNSTTYNYATGNAFTLEAWVKINASANSINTIIGKKSPGGGTQGYAFYVNSWGSSDRKLVFEATTGTFLSTSTIPNDTWTHVAVSVTSAGAATMYINGVASGSGNVTIPTSSNTLSIGAFGSNSYFYFNGGLDEIRIWNVAKTASEINTYKSSDVRGFANLDLYYKLNEGTGTTANDSSPNNNPGTLNNFALSGSRSNWVSSSFQDVATISGNSNVCLGSTTNLVHTATGGTWSSATTSVATIDANGIVTAVAAGTSIISYTYTYNGCSFTDTKTITVVNSPVAPTVTSTMNFCQSSTANLSATASSGHTLKWYTAATGGTGSTTVPVVFTSTVASTSYYVSQVNTSTGCESPRAIITAVVNPTPVVSGTNAIEVGATTALTATTTAASSNAWTSSNTSVATVDNTGIVTAVAPGTTVITYTNSTGCSATKNITVSVGITQTPVLIHPASNITGATTFRVNYTLPEAPLAGSVRLTFVPTSGGNPIVWTMSNATSVDFNYTVTAQPNVTYVTNGTALSYGTYNVTLSYQDAFGSPAASAFATNIQTLAPPSISFATTTYSTAVNAPIIPITPTNTGGVGTYSISPNLPTGLIFNTATGTISGTPTVILAQTTFTITATNAAGSDSKTIQLTVDADSDGDAVPDAIEVQQGTNPNTPGDALDTDGDGVPDYVELQQGTNPNTPGDALDTDGDGVPDYIELQQGTSPTTPGARDTDGDGVPDYVELQQGTSPTTPGARDTDGDGVPDYVEVQQGTNPTTPGALDTDGDGVPDYIELQQGTSPTTPGARDTDGDGVPDYVELQQGTSPTTPGARDTDGDGIPDYIEVQQGTNPNQSGDTILDTDGDGIPDYVELQQGTNPTTPGDVLIDTDGDGVPDYIEVQQGTSPTTPGARDTDGDGVPDYVEVQQGTNPNVPGARDTDSDGIPDYIELQLGTNPNVADAIDSDGDGISDYNEGYNYSNPSASLDTDRDGIPNYLDLDSDGDSVLDRNDAFPVNRLEWKDTDHDGTGDNADTDDDNDGILDTCDADVNGDGIIDNGTDMDSDGVIDGCDPDRDGDGVNNTSDNCPDTVNRDQIDRDNDGLGDVCDTIELNVMQGLTPNGDGINDTWVIYNIENHPGSKVRVFNANGAQVYYSANYQNNWTGNLQGSSEMLPVGSYMYQIDLEGDGTIDVQGWLYITK
jgi:gliding motility-associated-like protein